MKPTATLVLTLFVTTGCSTWDVRQLGRNVAGDLVGVAVNVLMESEANDEWEPLPGQALCDAFCGMQREHDAGLIVEDYERQLDRQRRAQTVQAFDTYMDERIAGTGRAESDVPVVVVQPPGTPLYRTASFDTLTNSN